MKKWLILLMVFVVGCSKTNDITKVNTNFTAALSQNDYRFANDEKLATVRDVHRERNRKVNIHAIRKGMMEISKMYFSPDEYILNELDILSYDRLTKSNQYQFDDVALLNYASEENPYGLNPKKDEIFTIGKETIQGPAFINDIFELDFIQEKNRNISAIVTTLVLSKKPFNQNNKEVEVEEAQLVAYGKEASNKLKTFFSTLPQLANIPTVVALYVSESDDIHIPGRFVGYTLFAKGNSKYIPFNEQYYYLGNTHSQQRNGGLNNIFTIYEAEINKVLYEHVGVVGLVRTVDNQVIDLTIQINAQFKSFIEEELMLNKIHQLFSHFKDDSYRITVTLKDVNEVKAIFVRNRQQSNVVFTRR